MRLEFWFGGAVAAWALIGWIVWLYFCWAEGTSEPKGDDLFSASFIAHAWPLMIVLVAVLGALFLVFYPFKALHDKVSESVARRGRERRQAGIARGHDGKVIEEFGVRKD